MKNFNIKLINRIFNVANYNTVKKRYSQFLLKKNRVQILRRIVSQKCTCKFYDVLHATGFKQKNEEQNGESQESDDKDR